MIPLHAPLAELLDRVGMGAAAAKGAPKVKVKPVPRLTAESFRCDAGSRDDARELRGWTGLIATQPLPGADYFAAMKATGADHARVWLVPRWDEASGSYVIAPAQYAVMSAGLSALQRVGLHAVLAVGMHAHDEPKGNIRRIIAFAHLWGSLARRYKGRTVIAAFDLLNEPAPWTEDGIESDTGGLMGVYAAAAAEIRRVEPGRVLVLQCIYGYPFYLHYIDPLPLPNLVYSFHSYVPHELTHWGTVKWQQAYESGGSFAPDEPIPSFDAAAERELMRSLQGAVDWQARTGKPIYVGETSCVAWANGRAAYLRAFTGFAARRGWSVAVHAWRAWVGWDMEAAYNPEPPGSDVDPLAVLSAYFKGGRA